MRMKRITVVTLLAAVVTLVPATPGVAAVTQNLPITSWGLPAQNYDGIGSWIIMGNVPTAGPGQTAAMYAMVHEFDFVNHPQADPLVMLGIEGTARFAQFVVYWDDGRILEATVPFQWQPNRWYFPFVYRAGEGIWAAFVYDLTAAAATYIGSHVVPADWGPIDRESSLYVDWFGEAAATCPAYPHADVYRLSPTGYVGQQASQSVLLTTTNITGTCPGTVSPFPDANWSHFLMA